MVRGVTLLFFFQTPKEGTDVFAHEDHKRASIGKSPLLNVWADRVMKYIEHTGASKNSIKNKVLPNLDT